MVKYYAVIQYGYVICGVGVTPEEAVANAREEGLWGEIKTEFGRIVGESYLLPCDVSVWDAVNEFGGSIPFDVVNGMVQLEDD